MEERSDGVEIFIAAKCIVSVERHSKRLLLDNGLLNVLMVYAPHSVKLEEEKSVFGMKCSS